MANKTISAKKLLSILGTISLITGGSSNLISCNKPNNNESKENNKPKTLNPQQPPERSNWKLIHNSLTNIKKEFSKYNNKWYFIIWKRGNDENWIWQSMFFKYDESAPRITGAWLSSIKSIYRSDTKNKPNKPIFDLKTERITDWKLL